MAGQIPFDLMEAQSVSAVPRGNMWQYEPKWDGFRCLLMRDVADIHMWSKSGQDLTRYFPEVASAAAGLRENKLILDGEIVVPVNAAFSFDALLQRIHPAASRVSKLAAETPALFIAFDLLQRGGRTLAAKPQSERRKALEAYAAQMFGRADSRFRLSPASTKVTQAERWLATAGAGTDGVIAKRRDLPYQAGNRDGMQKIKRYRSADCVIGGFRYGERRAAGRKVVGSILLGLYDDDGLLHHVGFSSGIKAGEKLPLTESLEAIFAKKSFTGNAPGGPSRWSTARSAEWQPVRPTMVVEVSYDHFSEGRFRHGTSVIRWRSDKSPHQCTMDQLVQKEASAVPLFRL